MINKLQTLLKNTITAGKFRLNCVINPEQDTQLNGIMLFYNSDSDTNIMIGKHTATAFLSIGVQVAVRHSQYDTARASCIAALTHLGVSREQTNMSISLINSTPTYKGIDSTGGHIFSFDVNLRGKET